MILACSTLVIPAAYHASRLEPVTDGLTGSQSRERDSLAGLLTISRGTAIVRPPFIPPRMLGSLN